MKPDDAKPRTDTDLNARETRPTKRQRPSRYTDEEIDQGLFALVLASGNSRRAAAMLADRGLEIPHTTWKHRTHPDRYERVKRRAR